jgi:CHAT domain-containing protein/Tfp pilus assembly protein PilF
LDPSVAEAANNLASVYRYLGRFDDADGFYNAALAIDEVVLGRDDLTVAVILGNLAELRITTGRFSDAEPLLNRARTIYDKMPDDGEKDDSAVIGNLGVVYQSQAKYEKARDAYQQAISIREKVFGKDHPQVAPWLCHLADLDTTVGKYDEAGLLFRRALAIDTAAFGENHPGVARDLSNLAALDFEMGKNAEAESFYKRAIDVDEVALGKEHPDVASLLSDLGVFYYREGKYDQAATLSRQALDLKEKWLGPDHPDVANSLVNLALVYRVQAQDGQAELMLRRALTIEKKAFGDVSPSTASVLGNLGQLYESQGKYADAEASYREALKIEEATLGVGNEAVAIGATDLASLLRAEGKVEEAGELLNRALKISEKAVGEQHPFTATVLIDLALLYKGAGKLAEAEQFQRWALASLKSNFGEEHPDVVRSMNNLAGICHAQHKDAEAEQLFTRALAIEEKSMGLDSPRVADYMNNLAGFYYSRGKYKQAEPLFESGRKLLEKETEGQFNYMSEKDRLSFLDKVAGNFALYFSFCYAHQKDDPVLAQRMYDYALWYKGLVARSITSLRATLKAGGNAELQSLFQQLASNRAQLANLQSRPEKDQEQWHAAVRQLQQDGNDLESAFVRQVSAVAGAEKLSAATWQDVQRALHPNDGAVEFVRFPFHDGTKWTEESRYVALFLTADRSKSVVALPLGEAETLEAVPIKDYQTRVAPLPTEGAGLAFYRAFWKPLEPYLRGVNRIYVSPDGALNQVSFAVVPTEEDRVLMDKYDIYIVLSTQDVVRTSYPVRTDSAVLIGNPRFDLNSAGESAATQELGPDPAPGLKIARLVPGAVTRGSADGDCPDRPPGGVLCPLKNTEVEVNDIFSQLKKANWDVSKPYTQERALKNVMLSVRHPRLLHVATHGFFLSDEERTAGDSGFELRARLEDPMLRSGLMFAGADRALTQGEPANSGDSAILTAFEASAIDLKGTELVVLSACETGLGEIKNGEGVFGMRRALQEAGAESILMSLWSVKDQETSDLMSLFYENWLSGKTKHQALHEAEAEMRERTRKRWDGEDRPYYWGGFVLIGR